MCHKKVYFFSCSIFNMSYFYIWKWKKEFKRILTLENCQLLNYRITDLQTRWIIETVPLFNKDKIRSTSISSGFSVSTIVMVVNGCIIFDIDETVLPRQYLGNYYQVRTPCPKFGHPALISEFYNYALRQRFCLGNTLVIGIMP